MNKRYIDYRYGVTEAGDAVDKGETWEKESEDGRHMLIIFISAHRFGQSVKSARMKVFVTLSK